MLSRAFPVHAGVRLHGVSAVRGRPSGLPFMKLRRKEKERDMLIALIVLVAALAAWLLISRFVDRDRESWEPDAAPSAHARILEITPQRLRKEGKGARFKMTVRFSDGYVFVTRMNNRRDAVDDEFKRKVASKAESAHRIAVRKKKEQKES